MATVILLNGVGSAGKSSLAEALQSMTQQPFLHVEMDSFLKMIPERFLNHPDGLSFETHAKPTGVETIVTCGKVAATVLNGMRRAVAAMACAGNNLIVDEVIFGETDTGSSTPMAQYRTQLEPYDFRVVGVFAELDVLERRERERGDRVIGLSRWQYERVHAGMNYDFSVHTDTASPFECAEQIRDRFGL